MTNSGWKRGARGWKVWHGILAGFLLAGGSTNEQVTLWHTTKGELEVALNAKLTEALFSTDGSKLGTVLDGSRARFLEVAEGSIVSHAKGHSSKIRGGDSRDDELFVRLYNELRQIAGARMAAERPEHTLGGTALVHEAWLRLEKSSPDKWRDRKQFFAAAEAMRRILIEAARRRLSAKRGGGETMIPADEIDLPGPLPDEALLEVHEALDQLEKEDEMKARIVKLRFFGGLKNEEIAALLEVNEKTVRRHWAVAKVRLYRALKEVN